MDNPAHADHGIHTVHLLVYVQAARPRPEPPRPRVGPSEDSDSGNNPDSYLLLHPQHYLLPQGFEPGIHLLAGPVAVPDLRPGPRIHPFHRNQRCPKDHTGRSPAAARERSGEGCHGDVSFLGHRRVQAQGPQVAERYSQVPEDILYLRSFPAYHGPAAAGK